LYFHRQDYYSENQLDWHLKTELFNLQYFAPVHAKLFVPLSKTVAEKSNKKLSLMKLMRYISRNFRAIPQLLKAACGSMKNLKIVEKYCTYDKRKRLNYAEKELQILTAIETIVNLS